MNSVSRKWFVPMLLISLLLISACGDSNRLAGKMLRVAYPTPEVQSMDDPTKYKPVLTLEFLEDNVVNNAIYGEGTYEMKNDELELRFENDNESYFVRFDVEENNRDFSEFTAEIADIKYEQKDSGKPSRLQTLTDKLNMDSPIEFLKEEETTK